MKYDEAYILEILRYIRHDYLNELQLLKANMALNRLDRAEAIIEEIVNKAKTEAKLTNLHVPKSAMFLLGYNWKPQAFKLKLEVTGRDGDWQEYDEGLYTLFSELFNTLGMVGDKYADNTVYLTLHADEDSATIHICYSGKIVNHKFLEQYFVQLNQTYQLVEKYIQEEKAVITFLLTDHMR